MAWREQLKEEGRSLQAACELMARCNPQCIPRNHHVERVLAECESSGETRPIDDFLEVMRSPYTMLPFTAQYQDTPRYGDRNYRTFCGT